VNFGGPRDLNEVAPFLIELLCDRKVIRTKLPAIIHEWLFKKIAIKRALKVSHDYEKIGGRSPIYFDTETMREALSDQLQARVFTFHRYLIATHADSLKAIETSSADQIRVIPLFPQFCSATTGSIIDFFEKNLTARALSKLNWIKSYATDPGFVQSWQMKISQFLTTHNLMEEETVMLFSAHGIPKKFVNQGDPYEKETMLSFNAIMKHFPQAIGRLSYQSKFGPGEWLRPYTNEVSKNILDWHKGRKHVVFIPVTFTSDHIETLFEVDYLYLPLIRENNLYAYRCPALNMEPYWVKSLASIAQKKSLGSEDSPCC